MDKEKFAESFVRRFGKTLDDKRSYQIKFYDVNEIPPKVSVKVESSTSTTFSGSAVDIITQIDMVVESNNKYDKLAYSFVSDIKAN